MMRETDVTWFDIPYSNMTSRAPGMPSRIASVLQWATKAGVRMMNGPVMDSIA